MRSCLKLTVIICLLISGRVQAEDERDAEIFGQDSSQAPDNLNQQKEALQPNEPSDIKTLIDSMQIGGRLQFGSSAASIENKSFTKSKLAHQKQADIYFDSRPNPNLRSFLRLRWEQREQGPSSSDLNTHLDELWFKWDYQNSIFFTYGKQHIKWGSSKFWNPTDFLAKENKDPFALDDQRLGVSLLKIHIPNELKGFNYFAIIQLEDSLQADDIGLALRGEFAFLGTGEIAVSSHFRKNAPIRLGVDLSSGLGPVDVNIETSFSKRHQQNFYKGDLDIDSQKLPTSYQQNDRWFAQIVSGVQKSWQYGADDHFTTGIEYFYNELGYDQKELALYSLVMGSSKPLYASKQYVGAYLLLPNPGSFNSSSFFINGLHSLSDKTSVIRMTESWQPYQQASIEIFISRCLGDYGEFCFRIPSKYIESPFLSHDHKAKLSSLPTERNLVMAGVGFKMNF